MTRISEEALVTAITKVRMMSMNEKELLADEIFLRQPSMLASLLVLERFGVTFSKMEILTNLLFVCYQAMKESKIEWPLITEDDLDRNMSKFTKSVELWERQGKTLSMQALEDYVGPHPEKLLLAFVLDNVNCWLKEVEREESDRYVIMVAMSYVNCIAFVLLSRPETPGPDLPGRSASE